MSARERPIIFSGEMVRAILDGRKTQTRRVIRPRHFSTARGCYSGYRWWVGQHPVDGWWAVDIPSGPSAALTRHVAEHKEGGFRCPYGVPGDTLWIRETHHQHKDGSVTYRADMDSEGLFWSLRNDGCQHEYIVDKWTPSIHMPRWASRIIRPVKDVRVEWVQDISEEDARDEGVEFAPAGPGNCTNYVIGFADLWDSINAKRGYGWDVNPWVWRVEF